MCHFSPFLSFYPISNKSLNYIISFCTRGMFSLVLTVWSNKCSLADISKCTFRFFPCHNSTWSKSTVILFFHFLFPSPVFPVFPLQPRKESRLFPVLVVSRVVFIPLLMLCNVQSRSNLPVFFTHDAVFTTIMVFFSLSSGYFVALSMTYAPQLVQTNLQLMSSNVTMVTCLLTP